MESNNVNSAVIGAGLEFGAPRETKITRDNQDKAWLEALDKRSQGYSVAIGKCAGSSDWYVRVMDRPRGC